MDPDDASYYDVLNISPRASDEEVKQAFRTMALIYHPDRNPHNPGLAHKRFQRISEAYHNLKTREKRLRYNKTIEANNDNKPDGSWLFYLAELFRTSKKQV